MGCFTTFIVTISTILFGGYFLELRNLEYILFCCFSFAIYFLGIIGHNFKK